MQEEFVKLIVSRSMSPSEEPNAFAERLLRMPLPIADRSSPIGSNSAIPYYFFPSARNGA